MGSQTAAGSALALSAMLPTTHDAAGYAALTFVEIGQVEKLGSFGANFAKVEFQPLKGAKQKYKGSADFGALQPSIAIDSLDASQILLQTASDDETQKLYSFRVTYQDGSKRYFRGRVFGAPETADGADSMLMATPTVKICTRVVKVDASGVTPAPSPTLSQPSISPTSGAVGTTFTATDGTVTNGTLTGRRWLLGTTAIGTGTTVTPNAAGSLTRENTAVGTNGETITSTSAAITVSAATSPTVTLSAAQSKLEGNSGATLFTYTVSRSSTSGAVNVPWSFIAGTTSADDFTGGSYPTGGNVAMADGVASGTFSVSVNGDTAVEPDESFTVLISTPSGYTVGANTSATGTILNDDTSTAIPLRTVAVQNRANTGRVSLGNTNCTVRWPLVLGTDVSDFVLNFNNWLWSSAEFDNTNDFTIVGAVLENEAATVSVPVTMGGARTFTIAAGANDINADPILPSAFALAKGTAGELYWFKAILSVSATTGQFPYSQRNINDVSGSAVRDYSPAATTPSSVDTLGPFTFTGTAAGSNNNGYCPILLGHPIVDGPSFFGAGDSIFEITNDGGTGTNKRFGYAFFQRAMHDAGTATTGLRASLNFAKVGIASSAFANGTKWRAYLKYAKHAVEELGTNDIATTGSANVTTIQTRLQTVWDAMKAGGIQTITRTKYLPRSTSSNSFIDKDGQTPSPGWRSGEARDQLNTWFSTKVTDGTLYGFADTLTACADAADDHYWLTNGSTTFATSDGTHPKDARQEAMAVALRSVIGALS